MNQDVNKDISIIQISPAWSTVAYHRMTGSFVISMAPAGERLGGSLEISHAAAHSLCEALHNALMDIDVSSGAQTPLQAKWMEYYRIASKEDM